MENQREVHHSDRPFLDCYKPVPVDTPPLGITSRSWQRKTILCPMHESQKVVELNFQSQKITEGLLIPLVLVLHEVKTLGLNLYSKAYKV